METVLDVGLKNALVATGLALVAAAVGRTSRRPALAHALWLLVLLKLVTPPLFTVALPRPSGWQGTPVADGRAELRQRPESAALSALTRPGSPEQSGADTLPALTRPGLPEEEGADSALLVSEPAGPAVEAEEPAGAPTAMPPSAPPFQPPSWEAVLAAVWLTGSVAWFALAGWRLGRFRRLLRYTEPAPPALQEQARQVANRLGLARCPGVWLVPAAVSPMLWALGGVPRLLVPRALWERLSEEGRDTLLAHELAHLRRGDHWVRRLELLVLGLYWWFPVAWWARRELREAEEQCCDAWVVSVLPAAAPAYAATLVETVAFLSRARPALPPAASGIGHVHFLRRRLTMIMRGTTTPRALPWVGFWAVLALGAVLLPLLPTWAQSDGPSVGIQEPQETAQPLAVAQTTQAVTQPPAAEAPRAGAVMAGGGSGRPPVDAAGDQVEILQVQLEGKHAELREIEVRLGQAKRRLTRAEHLHRTSAISEEELEKLKDDAELLAAQLAPKQAQVREVEIRLRQAQRRLSQRRERPSLPPPTTGAASFDTFSGAARGLPFGSRTTTVPAPVTTAAPAATPQTATYPAAGGTAASRAGYGTSTSSSTGSSWSGSANRTRAGQSTDQRLEELEKKLDALLREVNALRRELRPGRTGGTRSERDPRAVPPAGGSDNAPDPTPAKP